MIAGDVEETRGGDEPWFRSRRPRRRQGKFSIGPFRQRRSHLLARVPLFLSSTRSPLLNAYSTTTPGDDSSRIIPLFYASLTLRKS